MLNLALTVLYVPCSQDTAGGAGGEEVGSILSLAPQAMQDALSDEAKVELSLKFMSLKYEPASEP